jgi:protein-disulfide isomerase
MKILRRRPSWTRRADWLTVALVAAGIGVYTVRTVSRDVEPGLFGESVPRAALQEMERSGLGHTLGNPAAPVKIVEFVDYQCPACAAAHDSIWPAVERQVREGRVHYTTYHLPLPIHKGAVAAASVLECTAAVGGPDQFWSLRRDLLHRRSEWTAEGPIYPQLLAVAGTAGVDTIKISECLRDNGRDLERKLLAGRDAAVAAQLTFTPVYAVDGKIVFWGDVREHLEGTP